MKYAIQSWAKILHSNRHKTNEIQSDLHFRTIIVDNWSSCWTWKWQQGTVITVMCGSLFIFCSCFSTFRASTSKREAKKKMTADAETRVVALGENRMGWTLSLASCPKTSHEEKTNHLPWDKLSSSPVNVRKCNLLTLVFNNVTLVNFFLFSLLTSSDFYLPLSQYL